MRKFPLPLLTIALAVASCSGNPAPYRADLRGDMPSGASTYFGAMVRRDGEDLVDELRAGESELVFLRAPRAATARKSKRPFPGPLPGAAFS